MRKKAVFPITTTMMLSVFCFGGIVLLGGASCSTTGMGPAPQQIAVQAPTPGVPLAAVRSKHLWSVRPGGTLTDLSLSRDGKWIWVAARPEVDLVVPISRPRLSLMDAHGKVVRTVEPGAQVREIAVSSDGSLLVASTHDDEVIGYVREGGSSGTTRLREIFRSAGTCRPRLAEAAGAEPLIVCYHDDDADSSVAFHVLDRKGARLTEFTLDSTKAASDVLALKVSRDGKWVAVGATGGKVFVFSLVHVRKSEQLQPDWTIQTQGEIVDVALESGAQGQLKVAVLHGKKISWIDRPEAGAKNRVLELTLEQRFEQLGFVGESLAIYSNTPAGQSVQQLVQNKSGKLEARWQVREAHAADYSSALTTTDQLAIACLDRRIPPTHRRVPEVVALGTDGATRWSAPVTSDEGSFTAALDYSPSAKLLIVTTDDGQIHGYQTE